MSGRDIALVDGDVGVRLEQAGALFREYADSLPFDLGFQDFEQELARLPGPYAPPLGRLLLALVDEEPVGCVAIRPLADTTAELKRLYVRPAGRGIGAGRTLAQAAVEAAGALGYTRIVLDTAPGMDAAVGLYRSLGFVEIPAYRLNPVPGATYLELTLRP